MYVYYYKLNCFLILYGPDHIIAFDFLSIIEKIWAELPNVDQTSSHFLKPNSKVVDEITHEM